MDFFPFENKGEQDAPTTILNIWDVPRIIFQYQLTTLKTSLILLPDIHILL